MKVESQNNEKTLFDTFTLMKWSIKLWIKLDWFGFVGYTLTESITPILNVSRWYVFAMFIDNITDYASKSGNIFEYIWFPSLLIILISFLFRLVLSAGIYFNSRRYQRLEWKLIQEYIDKLESLSLYDVDNRDFANKIALANDAKDDVPLLFMSIVHVLKNLLATIVIGIPLIIQGYTLIFFGIIIVAIPSVLVNIKHQREQVRLKLSRVEEKRKSISAIDVHTGISEESKEMKINDAYSLLSTVGVEEKRYFNELLLAHQKRWLKGRIFSTAVESVAIPSFSIYYVWKAVLVEKSVSGVIPFFSTINTIRILVYNFMHSIIKVSEHYEEMLRIKDFLEFKPNELFSINEVNSRVDSAPSIELKNVKFKYPGNERYILNGLNLKINKGEKIAVVGVNGAGKTTLTKLILGMYPLNDGQIKINDNEIFSYTKEQWYSSVGVLFQQFPKYGFLSVKENISIGNPKLKEEKLMWEMLDKASAKDFVAKYPNQLNQILDHKYKDGISPSTGQWQKLAIARMFYRNPQLVIFDEPTASIDAEAEFKIFNEIFEFFKNKTVIIVSHRFSTVKNADKIIVIDGGEIIEQGSHEELIERNGQYANSYMKQLEAYK